MLEFVRAKSVSLKMRRTFVLMCFRRRVLFNVKLVIVKTTGKYVLNESMAAADLHHRDTIFARARKQFLSFLLG